MTGGSFCCVVGCSASSKRCKGLSFHRIPSKCVSKESAEWRARLIISVNRCDGSFNSAKAKICSRHFHEDCFITKPSGRRQLKPGSLPTRFMPRKSVETPKPPPRKAPLDRLTPADDSQPAVTVSAGIVLNGPCPGITDEKLQIHGKLPQKTADGSYPTYYRHVTYQKDGNLTTCTSTIRAQACKGVLLSSETTACKPCLEAKRLVLRKEVRRVLAEKQNVKKCSPLSRISKARVENALKLVRAENLTVQKQLQEIRKKIREECVEVSEETHTRLHSVITAAKLEQSSFVKKFWDEQQKAFCRKSGGMRWHPQMVRFAVLLHSQSPSAYRALREMGVLRLPSESSLKDYTNVLHPAAGFQIHVFQELANMTKDLNDNERWVCLLHDEISIKSSLVYDRRSGELVGCIPEEQRSGKSDHHLATHALVFMVVGVTSNIKMSLGYFPTKTATADEIFPLLWKAVGLLECVCNLKVIASTSDKASPNQRLIGIHGRGVHKAINVFAPDRFLYFVSDVPHLIKTVRNNLASSGWGKNTRRLWNNGSELLWSHVKEVYDEDTTRQLKRTRLTADHIYLSPQSVMRVYLAAQVLSRTVGRVMQTFGRPECQETAKFILLMDAFFDCLNSRSAAEGLQKNNPYLLPYQAVDDDRFQFLREEFLGYIEHWRESVQSRDGFSMAEKEKMFLSRQTYEGIKTTVNSVIEATQFLLNSGVSMVLTNRFCQDPLEEHFGRHRCMGIRAENPTLWSYGYQENKLRIQRSLALSILPRGNIRGKRRTVTVEVDDTPLPKIRRQRKDKR